jgi:hypothetical protein
MTATASTRTSERDATVAVPRQSGTARLVKIPSPFQ